MAATNPVLHSNGSSSQELNAFNQIMIEDGSNISRPPEIDATLTLHFFASRIAGERTAIVLNDILDNKVRFRWFLGEL